MTKKTRLPFSALSIEHKKEEKTPVHNTSSNYSGGENKIGEKRKTTKSSTYQYSKFGKKQGRRNNSSSGRTPLIMIIIYQLI